MTKQQPQDRRIDRHGLHLVPEPVEPSATAPPSVITVWEQIVGNPTGDHLVVRVRLAGAAADHAFTDLVLARYVEVPGALETVARSREGEDRLLQRAHVLRVVWHRTGVTVSSFPESSSSNGRILVPDADVGAFLRALMRVAATSRTCL